jgi:PKD repeat protein
VRVNSAPTAQIDVGLSQTAGVAVQFNSSAQDSDGSVEDYSWDFGDGTQGSGPNPSHTYAAAGTYTVKLSVIDNNFATGSDEVVVNVAAAQTGAGGPAKVKAKKKADKLVYTVETNEAASIVANLSGKVKGGATVKFAKAGSGKVAIKLSSKAKKALRAAKSVKLTLVTTATDAAGNKTTKTTKVTLV